MILFEKQYHNYFDSVSSPDETPQISSKILCCKLHFYNSLLHVSSGNETLCLMLDILHEIPFVPLLQVFKYVF